MGRMIIWVGVLFVALGTALPSEAIWIICWDRKVAGVAGDGTKTYCKKCYSKEMRQGWNVYADKPNCKVFVRRDEAEKWYAANCDCP